MAVRSVSKAFGRDEDFVALADVHLDIRDGEFVSLVGPSGCGKSTLLRIVSGLLPPTSGEVQVYGNPVAGPRRDVSIMFQEPTLFPWRTVLANTLLPIEIARRPSPADVDKARQMLAMTHLEEFERHYPRELSGGMQQRAALSRVLMAEPRLMLLDEPFGALDEFTRERLNGELADLALRTGASVLLVTHSIVEAVLLSDRVVTMGTRPGRILKQFQVPLERPRSMGVMRESEFQDLVFAIRQALGIETS